MIETLFTMIAIVILAVLLLLASRTTNSKTMMFTIALLVLGVVVLALFAEASIVSAEQFMAQFRGAL